MGVINELQGFVILMKSKKLIKLYKFKIKINNF